VLNIEHAIRGGHSRGIDQAQHYAEANRSGARQICDWVVELGIACDLESKAAYAYARDPARRDEIAAEAEAARRVGFDAEVLDRAPLPFDTAAALRFRDQAQFNPAKYLVGLALAVEAEGGRIFENTRVTAILAHRRRCPLHPLFRQRREVHRSWAAEVPGVDIKGHANSTSDSSS
jgi:glycine/D-amino acid oxidase-like deaminating enzyme